MAGVGGSGSVGQDHVGQGEFDSEGFWTKLTVKHKKPTLINRLTKSGLTRYQAQVTVGEQLAQTMMRRRARECGVVWCVLGEAGERDV